MLLRGRFGLIFSLPLGVGHAVDRFAGFVHAQLDVHVIGCGLVPFGQAVAAETGQRHQVDVLHILATAQVADQVAEGRSFQFKTLLLGHDRLSFMRLLWGMARGSRAPTLSARIIGYRVLSISLSGARR